MKSSSLQNVDYRYVKIYAASQEDRPKMILSSRLDTCYLVGWLVVLDLTAL